jgi:hypothetical protein
MPVILITVSCGQEASFQDNAYGRQAPGKAGSESGLDSTAAEASIDSEVITDASSTSTTDEDGSAAADSAASVLTAGASKETGTGAGVPASITPAELAMKCTTTETIQYQQVITFAQPEDTCAWGTDAVPINGNLGKKDQRVSARYQQDVLLKIPDNALLCSVNLDFIPEGAGGQQMYYDDEIFMTFNDVILAASQSYDTAFTKKDGFMVYDWEKLVGKKYGHNLFEPYCAGADSGQGECFIPETETNGVMKVNFSDAVVQGIAVSTGIKVADSAKPLDLNKTSFKFSFVTIGDNDAPADCKHSKFEFQVAAKYVVFK